MDIVDEAARQEEMVMGLRLRAAQVEARAVCGSAECCDCGEPIPEARRLACPGAVRCVACQREVEALVMKVGCDESY